MSDLRLRPATLADLDAIMQLERVTFPADAWSEATMAAELAYPGSRYVVAEDAAGLLGYGGARITGTDGDIQTLAVAEAARGLGLGRALLEQLIAALEAEGVTHILLEVREDNVAAIALYESAGFELLDRRRNYYGRDQHALVMVRGEV